MANPTARERDAKKRFACEPDDARFAHPQSENATRRKEARMDRPRALTDERATQILMEETVARRPRTLDTSDEEREYRRDIRRDVAKMKDAGIEIVVPTT